VIPYDWIRQSGLVLRASSSVVAAAEPIAWAVTDKTNTYRYLLGRRWNPRLPVWLFCMLNPSTARIDDDHTVTKLRGFVARGRGGGFLVGNAMAYSETQPGELVKVHTNGVDVVGEHNMGALAEATASFFYARQAHDGPPARAVVAWGKIPAALEAVSLPSRTALLARISALSAGDVHCFGENTDGSPKHPLRLGYGTPLRPYGRAA